MKKTFLAILFAAGLLSMAACNSGNKTEQAEGTETEVQATSDEMTTAADSTMIQDSTSSQ